MCGDTIAIIVIIILTALIVVYSSEHWCSHECEHAAAPTRYAPGARERYGPPPGMVRAIDHNELPDDRGWPGMDKVYNANTASSISHMIERSA